MTDFSDAVARVQTAVEQKRISATGGENLVRWLTKPQYKAYQAGLAEAVQQDQMEQLDLLFWEVIPFGTGGRRGLMSRYGSATINERTIAESADGMARYLQKSRGGKAGGSAVIAARHPQPLARVCRVGRGNFRRPRIEGVFVRFLPLHARVIFCGSPSELRHRRDDFRLA